MSELNEQLARTIAAVKANAKAKLAFYAKSDASTAAESFLFRDGCFCGIRIAMGAFEAFWLLEQDVVSIRRGDHVIDQVVVGTESPAERSRAA